MDDFAALQKPKYVAGTLVACAYADNGAKIDYYLGVITQLIPPKSKSDIWLYQITWTDNEYDVYPADVVESFLDDLKDLKKLMRKARMVER